MRAPPACSDSRVASVIGVARPAYVVSNRESSAVNVGSAIASVYATPNSSSAAARASGTNGPPKGPNWPLASGSLGAITEQAYGAQTAPRLLPVPQGRVRPCCDKVGDRLARILVGDQPFANEHRVGARRRVREKVMWAADTRLCNLHNARRDARSQPCEQCAVDLESAQIAGVHPDDPSARIDGPIDLDLVMHLDERSEAERLGTFDQRHQGALVERRNDEQHHVGAVGEGFPQLIRVVDEVFTQQGNVDGFAAALETGERPMELARFGQDADDSGAAVLVGTRERCGIRDVREVTAGGTRPLHFGDDRDRVALQC